MPYATRDQMIALYGEPTLVQMTGGDGAVDDARLVVVIAAAEAEVNGYLQSVVPLPLAAVPDLIRLHACAVAYYYLDRDNPTDGAKAGYDHAIAYLRRVQDGKAGLGLDADAQPVQTDSDVLSAFSTMRFSDEALRGYGY